MEILLESYCCKADADFPLNFIGPPRVKTLFHIPLQICNYYSFFASSERTQAKRPRDPARDYILPFPSVFILFWRAPFFHLYHATAFFFISFRCHSYLRACDPSRICMRNNAYICVTQVTNACVVYEREKKDIFLPFSCCFALRKSIIRH